MTIDRTTDRTGQALSLSLARVYRYYLEASTDPHTERTFARDWPICSRGLAEALRRIGSPVYWLDREPLDPDDTPFVVASIEPAAGFVRFDSRTAAEVRGLPNADGFRWDGSPIAGD